MAKPGCTPAPSSTVGAIGLWPVSPEAHHDIRRIGQILTNRFALCGLFGVDFILDGDRVWTIEVNPWYPASAEVVQRATGISMLATHAEAFVQVLLQRRMTRKKGRCLAKLFSSRGVTIGVDLRLLSHDSARGDGWPALADVPSIGTRVASLHPVLTLFADATSADEVLRNLKARVAIVKRQLYVNG